MKGRAGLLMVGNFLSDTGMGSRQVCQELAARLEAEEWTVVATSARANRVLRLADMVRTAITRRRDFAIAHIDVFSGPAFRWAEIVAAVLRRLDKPYLLSLHGGELPTFARRRRRRVAELLRSARAVTCPSPYLKHELSWAREDILLIPNGIDLAPFSREARSGLRPRLRWLRAFHRLYDPALAVSVAASLVEDHPNVELVMHGPDKGDGSLEEVRAEVNRLGLEKNVAIGGAVAKEEVPAVLVGGDIFLNTTKADNAPVSVVEAMAAGLCVVSTRVGGIPFLLEDGENALLTPPGDAEAMAAAVKRLLNDHAFAAGLAEGGMRLASGYDWSVVLPRWTSLLGEVSGRD